MTATSVLVNVFALSPDNEEVKLTLKGVPLPIQLVTELIHICKRSRNFPTRNVLAEKLSEVERDIRRDEEEGRKPETHGFMCCGWYFSITPGV